MITITRALSELKLLDKRINKEIEEFKPIGLIQSRKNIVIGTTKTEEDFLKETRSKLSSIQDLIKRRSDIKSAIIKSNAATNIKINGLSMTVAEGIERKNSIEYDKKLQNKLNLEGVRAINEKENHNLKLQKQVEDMLLQNYGKDRKANADDYDSISKPFLESNELRIVDPIDYDKTNAQLYEDITKFEAEIDFILSESNAKTKIDV
jgi:hypothetical protein